MKKLLPLLCLFCATTLLAQSTKKGGFIYNWNNYTSDENTGLGNRAVVWDSTEMADIVHAPATGIHPRVYFGPSEIPDIKNRLENTPSGQAVKAQIHAYATLLHLGSSYNQNANYALDDFNNRYIDNSGAWNGEPFYTALKNQDPTAWDGATLKNKSRTAALMASEAFMCLLYAGETDPDVGLDYDTRAQDLANAMYFWAQLALAHPDLGPTSQNYLHFGGAQMALCYDLNYNHLSPTQRDTIRLALSKIIPDEPRHGGNLTCYVNTSNWSTLNTFEIIINLAMEGEPGYKPQLTDRWMRALHTFINYGWYPSGAGYEGLGKNYQFVTTLIVCAKRGYSLLPHPHVRAYGEQFLPAILQPFGDGFTSYDVWGGSGYDPVRGQYKFSAADAVGLKWIFPNSQKVDFVWRNYINNFYQINSNGYVYAQIYPDDSYNNYLIPAAVFALDYNTNDWQAQADQTIETDYLALDRGLAVFKTNTDREALAVQFHARQDMGGHTHGDRLDFTLSGLGRIWIRKSYGGSQFQPSKFHSMILVDSIGMGVGDPDGDKCRQPATILNTQITPELSSVSADATSAYSWEWHWSPQLPGNDHPWLGNDGWEAVTESWNDFLPTPQSEAHYDIPFYDYPHWHQPGKLERMVKRPYNPMEKVVRNIGLLRGDHPMVLVVDDIKKDSEEHHYTWLGQIARDLEWDYSDVNLTDENYRCDIVLKEPAATGNRRLLLRILENTNYDGSQLPGYIDTLDYVDFFTGNPYNPNPNWVRPRLVIPSQSVSPNYKMLIYPFEAGAELPVTHWNAQRDTLKIVFSEEERLVHFYKDDKENTQFELVEEMPIVDNTDHYLYNNYFRIYPNPAGDFIFINSDYSINKIEIYNSKGQLIYNKITDGKTISELNTSNLPSGTYQIKVEFEDGKIGYRQFVVQ